MTAPLMTPLPSAPVSTDSSVEFTTKADAHNAALVGFVTEANALAVFNESAAIASGLSETASTTSASNAAIAEGIASTKEGEALASRDNAITVEATIAGAAGLPSFTGNAGQRLRPTALEDGVEWTLDQFAGDTLFSTNPRTEPEFLLCDGSAFNQVTYPDLYTALGDSNILPIIDIGGYPHTKVYINTGE